MDENRFAFGENWKSFLASVNEARIDQAVASLRMIVGMDSLDNKTFLDIGCGSGLFSLAATRLGATVTSLDYDPQCVQCTEELRSRFGRPKDDWIVRRADVLDDHAMSGLGRFDIVYSWGVLHHTGDMQRAMVAASERVRVGGTFTIALYNDQGGGSRRWRWIKETFHRLPSALRPAWVLLIAAIYEFKFSLARLAGGRNPLPFDDWRAKRLDRGMSVWHDWVDWVGGLPFEVATPEFVIMPMLQRDFELRYLKTVGSGWGCNEFTFIRKK